MAVVMHLLVVFSAFISSPCISAAGFSAKLIHRNSVHNPYKNSTPHGHGLDGDDSAKRTLLRYDYLTGRRQENDNPNDFYGISVPDGGEFLAKISMGTPPMNVYAIADTGSNVFWVQCAPCNHCYLQTFPLYDRTKSSTFSSLRCSSSLCLSEPGSTCDNEGKCQYRCFYADGSRSSGFLANEVIRYQQPRNPDKNIIYVVFGCGIDNLNMAPGYEGGILGLGPRPISVVSQLSLNERKFSYCFANLSDPNEQGDLRIGDLALLFGKQTTLDASGRFYYVILLGISFGNQVINVSSSDFRRKPDGSGGVIIDNGSLLTVLPEFAYNELEPLVEMKVEEMFGIRAKYYSRGRPCYGGVLGREIMAGFPLISLHFYGGVTLDLNIWSAFYQVDLSNFCFALITKSTDNTTIIGNLAQQYRNFGFDLANSVLYVDEVLDCNS